VAAGEAELGAGVEVKDHRQGNRYCIQGYKGDPERRIGLVGGFGFEPPTEQEVEADTGENESTDDTLAMRSNDAIVPATLAPQGIDEGDGDDDKGVKLDAGGASTDTQDGNGTRRETKTKTRHASTAVRIPLNDLLQRINAEFAGVGEVFDFASHTAKVQEDSVTETLSASTTTTAAVDDIAVTAAGVAPVAASSLSDLHDPDQVILPIMPPTSSTASNQEQPPPQPPPQPFKRQKKSKSKPKAPPLPPLPPSLPLATAAQGSTFPAETNVTAVAIMNAFHPEEIKRAIGVARKGGWIGWEGVGVHSSDGGGGCGGATATASKEGAGDQDTTIPISALSAGPAHELGAQSTAPGTAPSTTPTPGSPDSQFIPAPILNSSHFPPPSQPPPTNLGHILFLTGAARGPGLQYIKQHYADRATVVCVGHAACEEWGVRFLAAECARRWPGIGVRVVFEDEGGSGKDGAV